MNSLRLFFDTEPNSWQDLETQVHQAFQEMGYEAHRDHEINTVRGKVRVDVYAIKRTTPIPTVVVCECKHWNKAVDQNVVYALRSVCADIGSHFGLVVSKVGFQAGAVQTREATNVHLLNFMDFQATFFSEWKTGIFMRLVAMTDALRPLIYNPYIGNDANLAERLEGVNVFKKYSVFFGDHRFTEFFVEDGAFPIQAFDPRGNPRELSRITIRSHREFYDLCAAGAADARRLIDA